MNKVLQVFLTLSFLCVVICAQAPKNPSQFPATKIEPFKIEPGSSFSASVSRPVRNSVAAKNARLSPELITQDFSEALDIIRDNYANADKVSTDKLMKSSLTTMLHSLDPHSNYYNATDYQDLLSDEQSEYSGIGVSIANYVKNGRVDTFVTATFPDSPALHAGLRFGDKIVSVDGENMTNKNSLYVREKIRGVKNSATKIVVERAASNRLETIEIRRATVPQPSVPDAYMLRPGVGYIDLTNGFNYTTADEFNSALKNLHAQGMNALILDLRDNPGGIVEQAVKIASEFLPAGQTVLTQRGRLENDNRNWKSFNKNPETASLVVLVNGHSASASEIVTGALQDCDRAIIVGEKTFGKGLVQSVLNLPYGSGLTLTTAKYYTPSGRSIQRDYSQGNLYDYYQHRSFADGVTITRTSNKTATGRNVFGGDGIMPDETIGAPSLTQTQSMLLDPLFFFTRELANGRVNNFENYKISTPIQFSKKISEGDFLVGNELFDAFRNYLIREKIKVSAEQIEANRKFITVRLRYNSATAADGTITANQILIGDDVQVNKAIDALPRAQNLAVFARRIAQKR